MTFGSRVCLALGGVGVASIVGLASIVVILRTPWLENRAVYQHRLKLTEGKDVERPEQFGFARNQVSSFYIETDDGVRLHAWHVLPLALYQKHYNELVQRKDLPNGSEQFPQTLNFRLLKDDPESRLVIHTHGSSGALTAHARADTYRYISGLAPGKIHVLAFDYRGFGNSTGSPTEEGVMADAQSVYKWATEVANIPPGRIVVFGHSMGAGPAISLVRELSHQDVSVAGLIIAGAFPSVAELLSEYRIFWLRMLPIKLFPLLARLLTGGMRNKWPNKDRLVEIIRRTSRYHVEIFHAEDDPIVPWYFSNDFFKHAVLASSDEKVSTEEFENEKNTKKIDVGEGGWFIEWPTVNGLVRQEVTRYGLHDKIMAHPQVALAIYRAFQSTDSNFNL
ncbi:hypothetical protein KJ359_009804 [Pestalotiopsis sp. 9143b]|nr:hypothetical protein KJ359_009804 [Pestalotiopsis sp. 9143b]